MSITLANFLQNSFIATMLLALLCVVLIIILLLMSRKSNYDKIDRLDKCLGTAIELITNLEVINTKSELPTLRKVFISIKLAQKNYELAISEESYELETMRDYLLKSKNITSALIRTFALNSDSINKQLIVLIRRNLKVSKAFVSRLKGINANRQLERERLDAQELKDAKSTDLFRLKQKMTKLDEAKSYIKSLNLHE